MIRRFAVLTLLLVAAAWAHTQETSAPVAQGRRVFQDQGCYGCHTVGKTGTPIGPDLAANGWLGVTEIRKLCPGRPPPGTGPGMYTGVFGVPIGTF